MLAYPNAFYFNETIDLKERLSDKQISQLENLLTRYREIFSNISGKTKLVEHHTVLISDKRIQQKSYRITNRQNEFA